jgi:hypothetical protein
MRDESLFIHDYVNQTTIHPLGLGLLIILVLFIFLVNRRSVVIPILVMACFIAPAQRIVVFGLDFNLIRILVLVGWVRLLLKGETLGFLWKTIDKVVMAWAVSGMLAYVALRGGAGSAIIYKSGVLFDSLGMYFLFRCLIHDMDDLKHLTVSLMVLSLPVSFFLLWEKQTGHNIFSVFGGVPEWTMIRHGKLRAQGAFAHAILAGCFWVSQLPLYIALWWKENRKWLVFVGVTTVSLIVYACASSTPTAGVVAVAVGFGTLIFRNRMKTLCWGIFGALICLHLVMKAPVWHLISRIDLVGGSTGYHRFRLIDEAIHRFGEWWVFGTQSTAYWGWYLFDTANMYVNEAVRGGFVTLVLFIAVLILAFQGVGRLLTASEGNRPQYLFVWALGVALFAHCMMFIAVSYFGQIIVVWYLLLAAIGSLTPVAQADPEPVPALGRSYHSKHPDGMEGSAS